MKILSVIKSVSYIVETDDSVFPMYKRYEDASWENLMGESWEPCHTDEYDLEQMYQNYINSK